ncbi:MAG: hypothetical protein QM737_15535 [Ferruginibacter sp.]
MPASNNQVKATIIFFMLIYMAVFLTGLRAYQELELISLINFITSLSILLYWIRKQLRITQHIYELREMVLLGIEILFLGVSVFSFFIHTPGSWTAITAFAIFIIHFVVLLLALIFMFTFKIKRLF